MNPITVIYHRSDFDGLFCREIAKRFFEKSYPGCAEYIGLEYGDPMPAVSPENALYMLDFSVPELMDHPRLNWIDHHKSAMDRFGKKPGYQIDGVAACRLAWQYFGGINSWPKNTTPTKEDFFERRVSEPWAVRLAGEYDIWDKRDPNAELFQHGLRSCDLEPIWSQLLLLDTRASIEEIEAAHDAGFRDLLNEDGTMRNCAVNSLLKNGVAIQFAKNRENESIIRELGFTIQFEGLTFLACNHARYNSHLFTAGLTPEHDACFGFKWTGRDWSISLYHAPGKEHHDLSKIAVKHGGGGHKGACGFRCDTLPLLPCNP